VAGSCPGGIFLPRDERKKINVQDKCHPITPNFRQVDVFGGYTAAAGCAFIQSSNLPPRLQGMAMVCEPLDGIASRATPEYIRESLLEPSKVLAKGYETTGLSPMPPMGDLFSPQELADIQSFLQTLK